MASVNTKNEVVSRFFLPFNSNISIIYLEKHAAHSTKLLLFLDEDFKVLVDDSDGKENTGSRANGTKTIGQDGEGANAHASEPGGSWNVSSEFVSHRAFTESSHDHSLFFELL